MKGRVSDALVSQLDLFPTFCDLLQLEKPDWLQGVSLQPLLEGVRDRVREEITAEVTFHAAYEPLRCIRTERYKLIRAFGEQLRPIPSNTDDGPAKDFLITHGYLEQQSSRDFLADLYLDPVERINRSEEAGYREIYADLSRRLEQWMSDTDDPLFEGKVSPPKGARVNRPECISPGEKNYE
jgi:arylsulfatase A-like enzyme